jgi:hypothetical protein
VGAVVVVAGVEDAGVDVVEGVVEDVVVVVGVVVAGVLEVVAVGELHPMTNKAHTSKSTMAANSFFIITSQFFRI